MLTLATNPHPKHFMPPRARKDYYPNNGQAFEEMLGGEMLRKLAPHQHLFHQGDDDGKIYKIESGLVRLYRVLCDGRRQIISLRFAGDIVGVETGSERHCSAEAVSQVTFRSLDRNSAYRRLREEPTLAPQFMSLLSRELENARGQIAVLNRRSAIEKLSAFILELYRRQGESCTIRLDLSRSDIADFLGLTIETVSRNLTKLKVQRIIHLPEVHELVIRDIDRLEALASGESEEW